jgi:hypothetical protein
VSVISDEPRAPEAPADVERPAGDAGSAGPTPRPRRPWWASLDRIDKWVGLFVLAACVTFVFVELRPDLLFRNTTPTGGDTAAHVWWPAYLRDHLLPWRLAGWSPDFYGGFAAGQFYFPVPALLILALDLFLPYNVAFKLGTIAGPVLLPVGAYVFARGLRLPRPAPALLAIAATAFLFFTGNPGSTPEAQNIAFNQHIAGGTLASTLAGEYSYALALALALAFFGTLAHALRTGRTLWLPAVLFAGTVMSHLVVGIFAVIGAVVIVVASHPLKTFGRAAAIAVVGGLLTAVWLLPLVSVLQYTTDMRYTPITAYTDHLFPDYLFGFHSLWPWEWGATLLIAIAIIGGIVGRRSSTFVVVAITALSGLTFRFWEDIQTTTVWNLRFLPFWYLGVFLLMGLGGAELIRGAAWGARSLARAWGSRTPPRLVGVAVLIALTVLLSLGALHALDDGKSFLPYWTRWNYRGYEDAKGEGTTPAKQTAEYQAFIHAFDHLPAGRVLWEGNSQLNVYGSPLALMLLPYWTHGRISSMEGVYYEASATTPYHFMATAALDAAGNSSGAVRGINYRSQSDFGLGVRWLQVLGIRYLAVHSQDAKSHADADPRLTRVATSRDFDGAAPLGWSIYRVAGTRLVDPLRYQPVVVDRFDARDQRLCRQRLARTGLDQTSLKLHEWQDCIGVPWFDDASALDRPLVAEGPQAWQRAGTARARSLPRRSLSAVKVSDVRSDDNSIHFHVSRTGVPVVVKESWYPNWEAEGAHGPYRATPNYMVVVPTRHDVTLSYGTTRAEWLGRVGTLAGVVGVGLLVWWPIRRRRAQAARAEAPGTPEQ